ncbi:MAG: hypothetical protein KAW14_03225 [Candidatus Aegiribacteria sp.]|nr:hypothetical protein [Candidatus Aegiribacteria sp.]
MKNKVIWIIAISAIAVILSYIACDCNSRNKLSEISLKRQCHANMNTLCTDQASFRDANGEWAERVAELDEFAGRIWPLVCPESREEYLMEKTDEGYRLSCPSGHGSIETGRRSWTEESDR